MGELPEGYTVLKGPKLDVVRKDETICVIVGEKEDPDIIAILPEEAAKRFAARILSLI